MRMFASGKRTHPRYWSLRLYLAVKWNTSYTQVGSEKFHLTKGNIVIVSLIASLTNWASFAALFEPMAANK